MRRSLFHLPYVLALLALPACQRSEGAPAASDPDAIARAEAEAIFHQRCVACHGAAGRGDGRIANALGVTPRDYTNREWQARVSDEDLRLVILRGGKSTGKSDYMPPNVDLESKPRVVQQLVKMVRAFGK